MNRRRKDFSDEELAQYKSILERGTRENPVSSVAFGREDSKVRKIVNALRKQGIPICTVKGKGYFLAKTPDDVEETIEYIESLKIGMERTIAALNRTYVNMQVQEYRKNKDLEV